MKEDKKYTIGEVSELLSVKEHTIRFWEKEFPLLKPDKNEKGRRLYALEDVKLLKKIKELLYNEKYTIKGALKELERDVKNLKITTEEETSFKKEKIEEQSKELTDKNLNSVLSKEKVPGEDYYKKINKEILLRVNNEIEDLIRLWQDFPFEIK